jgi:hypothetical protein
MPQAQHGEHLELTEMNVLGELGECGAGKIVEMRVVYPDW